MIFDEIALDVRVLVEKYRGPLDWLIALAQKKEVDLTKVSVSDILNQVTPFIKENIKDINFSIYLTYLLSDVLLLKLRDIFPDSADDLLEDNEEFKLNVKDILLYRKFKEVASILGEMIARQSRRINRLSDKFFTKKFLAEGGEEEETYELSVWNIAKAYYKKMDEIGMDNKVVSVDMEKYSLSEMIAGLEKKILEVKEVFFSELSKEAKDIAVVIYSILALLELYKLGKIDFQQDYEYGDFKVLVVSSHKEEGG